MTKGIIWSLAVLPFFSLQGIAQQAAPPMVKPGNTYGAAPSDATILFDGKGLGSWVSAKDGKAPAPWTVSDGIITVKPGAGPIQTKASFGNCQLHIEWRTPSPATGEGQNRGNSGIFLQSLYEVQVLDSYHNDTYADGTAGSIYRQYTPQVNVSLQPGQWQRYDIFYTAPVFKDDGSLETPAYVTVLQNGVLVQNHVAIKGKTFVEHPAYEKHGPLPLQLQDHGCLVSYRNIWIRKID